MEYMTVGAVGRRIDHLYHMNTYPAAPVIPALVEEDIEFE